MKKELTKIEKHVAKLLEQANEAWPDDKWAIVVRDICNVISEHKTGYTMAVNMLSSAIAITIKRNLKVNAQQWDFTKDDKREFKRVMVEYVAKHLQYLLNKKTSDDVEQDIEA